jgi:hypothetical protein
VREPEACLKIVGFIIVRRTGCRLTRPLRAAVRPRCWGHRWRRSARRRRPDGSGCATQSQESLCLGDLDLKASSPLSPKRRRGGRERRHRSMSPSPFRYSLSIRISMRGGAPERGRGSSTNILPERCFSVPTDGLAPPRNFDMMSFGSVVSALPRVLTSALTSSQYCAICAASLSTPSLMLTNPEASRKGDGFRR